MSDISEKEAREAQQLFVNRRGGPTKWIDNWVKITENHQAVLHGGDETYSQTERELTVRSGHNIVTSWVANAAAAQFNIDVRDYGVEVIDMEDDDIDIWEIEGL